MRRILKILSVVLSIMMVISIIPITASADAPTSGTCGDNITWEFNESTSTLTLSGEGIMSHYEYHFNSSKDEVDERPWGSFKTKIRQVIINEGITSVCPYAFCGFTDLYYITIPTSMTYIEEYAFDVSTYRDYGILAVNYLGSEKEWNNIDIGYANADLYNCEKIYFKDDYVPVSGSGTCDNSLTWTYDASTATLTFFGTGNMEDFSGNDTMFWEPSIYWGIRPWEDFEYEIKKVVISDGITSIGNNAFAMFVNLESIVIPDSVTKIGFYSFGCCLNLTDVYYSGSEDEWNNISMGNTFGSYNDALDRATIHYNYHIHKHNSVVTLPTCKEQGYTTYTCECGDSYIDDYVTETGHSYDSVVTPPTCTEQGYTTYTCECGDTYIDDYVDALGHEYKSVITPPTCTEQGYTTYTCECGDSYVDDYVDETGHSFGDWAVIKEATVDTEGEMERVCSCGEKEYNAIEKLSAVDDKEEVEDTNKEDVENPDIPNTSSNVASFAYSVFVFIAFACATTSLMLVRKRRCK